MINKKLIGPVSGGIIGSGSGESQIARPIDPYSPLWPAYWAQNPHLGRGVGAEAAVGEGDAGGGEGDGGDAGGDDIETLRREAAEAKRLREENAIWQKKHGEAEKHKKEKEREARESAANAAKLAGDFEAYEKSVNEKINGITQEIGSERDLYRSIAERKTSGAAASDLANRMAMVIDGVSTADGILPHISKYIGSKVVDGDLVPVVLDDNGRETAETLEDLEKRLRKIAFLKPFIAASNANGAGRPGGQGGGGNDKEMSRSDFDKLDPFKKREFSIKGGRVVD